MAIVTGGELVESAFRPPAVPLATNDPYLSVWSPGDRLYDADTRHWTGKRQALTGFLIVDGAMWRFAGSGNPSGEGLPIDGTPTCAQTNLTVTPLSSTYTFEVGGVAMEVRFTSPLLLDDLDVLARPVTYVSFSARARDGRAHAVKVSFDISGEWCVNVPEQEVTWTRDRLADGSHLLRMGTTSQRVLKKKGDHVQIDWGYVALIVPDGPGVETAIRSPAEVYRALATTGHLPGPDDPRSPRAVEEDGPVLAALLSFGAIGTDSVERFLAVAYDDVFAIEYFRQPLPAYWRRQGLTFEEMAQAALRDYPDLARRCAAFDARLLARARSVGGPKYADLVALAYRQAVAAHKLVADPNGAVLWLSKENDSNGCMGTVDVSYPSAPLFLLFNPELVKGMLRPILRYAASDAWPYPFAPHDVGRYPIANGQAYGMKRERQMPIEECGNVLILLAALTRIEGDASFAAENWDLVRQWAEYLRDHGLDPEDQLCTDDFAGHLAHNANLSIKAITALAGYALMCVARGKLDEAEEYRVLARQMAERWRELARDDDHYRLAFDRPGTWSLKYNLVWDLALGFGLFPPEVRDREVAYYLAKRNRYGTPLDSRGTYTKADWLVWVAALARRPEDFAALIAPLWNFLDESRSRQPFTDWYYTIDGRMVAFRARSVVGGVFLPLLLAGETLSGDQLLDRQ